MQERQFDPVSMQYTDSNREEKYQTTKIERINTLGQRTQEVRKKTFNIVSHEGPERKNIDFITSINSRAGVPNRRYHILNNLNLEDHKTFPIICNENLIWDKIRESSTVLIPEGKNREFNIVSNKFYKNDEDRRREEYERTKEHVLQKYWETHDYNPIKAKYYDVNKEQTYQEQRHILEEVQGTALGLMIPPSIQYSEGKSYNILNNSVYDENKLKASRTVQDQALNRMKVLKVESGIKSERDSKAEQAEARRMNKISFKRWENQVNRGYNMVTNVLDTESGAYTLPAPARPLTMWSKINANKTGDGRLTTAPVGGYRDLSGAQNDFQPSLSMESLDKQSREDNAATADVQKGKEEGYNNYHLRNRTPNMSSTTQDEAISPLQSFRSAASSSASSRINTSARRGNGNGSAREFGLPNLDLSKAEQPEKVVYSEPRAGPSHMAIPMVRTGGLSAYRD